MGVNYKQLGKRIKDVRLKKSMTQESLAEKTGVSSTYISHIESGLGKTSLETLVKICNVLDTTIDYLLANSVFKAKEYLNEDIAVLLKDCSSEELKLISDMIKVILSHRRDKEKPLIIENN